MKFVKFTVVNNLASIDSSHCCSPLIYFIVKPLSFVCSASVTINSKLSLYIVIINELSQFLQYNFKNNGNVFTVKTLVIPKTLL